MTLPFKLLLLISTLFVTLVFSEESQTDSFNQAVKREFVEKKTISENDLIHFILNLDEEVVQNPIPEHKKTAAFKFTLAYKQFQNLLQKHEDAINWEAVREFANNLLEESKRVQLDKKAVSQETDAYWETAPNAMVAKGVDHTCTIDSKMGTVSCSGDNTYGYGQTYVPSDLKEATGISAGDYHSCVLQKDGKVRCWGKNWNGETNVPSNLPKVLFITSHCSINCVILKNTKVQCWGGDAKRGVTQPPKDLFEIVDIQLLDDGMFSYPEYMCAIKADGNKICWRIEEYPPSLTSLYRVITEALVGTLLSLVIADFCNLFGDWA